jgi:hypothetical protein
MAVITFRNSRIVYYGPHECSNCGVLIVKMGKEWGGTAFTNPDGPVYPNSEWHPHVCDPVLVANMPRKAENKPPESYPILRARRASLIAGLSFYFCFGFVQTMPIKSGSVLPCVNGVHLQSPGTVSD